MDRERYLLDIVEYGLTFFPIFKNDFGHMNDMDFEKPKFTTLQFISLSFLMAKPNRDGIQMNKLTSFLGISKQQTTKLVDSLFNLQLIERSWNPNCRREVLVKLSPSGVMIFNKIKQDKFNQIKNKYKSLSDEELEEFHSHLFAIRDLINKTNNTNI